MLINSTLIETQRMFSLDEIFENGSQKLKHVYFRFFP